MVGFFSRVDAHVALECLKVAEVCATDDARVGLLPGVDQHVSAEMGHLGRKEGSMLITNEINEILSNHYIGLINGIAPRAEANK